MRGLMNYVVVAVIAFTAGVAIASNLDAAQFLKTKGLFSVSAQTGETPVDISQGP
jgi:hypothetical protein